MDSLQVPNNHRSFHQFDTFRTIATLCHMMSYSASPCHALVCGMVEADLPWLWAKLQLGGDVIWNKNQMKRLCLDVDGCGMKVFAMTILYNFHSIFIMRRNHSSFRRPTFSSALCSILLRIMIRIHRDANGLHGFQTTGLAQKPCPATPLMCRMAYESITFNYSRFSRW